MKTRMKLVFGIITVCVVVFSILYVMPQKTKEVKNNATEDPVPVTEEVDIIIDPGHGGDDPGKVGINQALEKTINLNISKKIGYILEEKNYNILYTRTDDVGMCKAQNISKVDDLYKRVELINKEKPKLVLSIHQNSYEESSIKGAQVFYYTHSVEAKNAAQEIQNTLVKLDSTNTRTIKDNNTYYMLKRTTVPTVIVECGFLSNASEADLLVDDTYQNQLAAAIVAGVEEYWEKYNL